MADDVAAHDWSVAGAGICGKPGRYGDVDVANADLHERRRYGSRAGEEDRDFESVRWGT